MNVRWLRTSAPVFGLLIALGLPACRKGPDLDALRQEGRSGADRLAQEVRRVASDGRRVLVLARTGRDGRLLEMDQLQWDRLEQALAPHGYELVAAGPDLRDPGIAEILPVVMHQGWPQPAFDRWIGSAKADAVVSLLGLPQALRPDWPPIVGDDLYPTSADRAAP